MVQLQTRLVAGVSIPDTAMITGAREYAQRLSEPYLFNTPCGRGCSQHGSGN